MGTWKAGRNSMWYRPSGSIRQKTMTTGAPVIAARTTQVVENRMLRPRNVADFGQLPGPADVAGQVEQHPGLDRPRCAEDRAGRVGRHALPRDEQLVLAERAVGLEMPRHVPRDVPRTLHVEPDRKVLAEQPVRRQQMGPEVVRQHDAAPCPAPIAASRCSLPVDGEHLARPPVGNAVEQQVPGSPQDVVARQLATHASDVPLAIQNRAALRDRLVE